MFGNIKEALAKAEQMEKKVEEIEASIAGIHKKLDEILAILKKKAEKE